MAAIGNKYLNIVDAAKRTDPNGNIADIAEVLATCSPLIEDMIWQEGNLSDGHRTTVRTGLPQGTWRGMYQGVQPTKSTTAQVDDRCGNLEAYSDVDADIADLNGNTAAFRISEDEAFLEGLTQQMTTALIYASGDSSPERLTGLAPRFNTVSTATALTANNVIDAGGTGSDNCSIWLVGHGPRSVFGTFPKGSKAGLRMDPKNERQRLFDASQNPFEGYTTHYKWQAGLVVRDWRYIARACNIDVSDLAGVSPANIARLFTRLIGKMPTMKGKFGEDLDGKVRMTGVKLVFYVPRAVWVWGSIQSQEKANMGFTTVEDAQGGPLLRFWGIPVKILDQLLLTEARVV